MKHPCRYVPCCPFVYVVLRQSPEQFFKAYPCDISSHAGAGEGVRFSLRGVVYYNNSLMTLEDIGERGDALFCVTDQPACCIPPYTGEMGSALGNWYFPNGTRVVSSGAQWDFHRTRGQSVVLLRRKRGGDNGIYHCEIPDAMNVTQTIYIGVYPASAGMYKCKLL